MVSISLSKKVKSNKTDKKCKSKTSILKRSEMRLDSAKTVLLHEASALQAMANSLDDKNFGKAFIDTLHLIDKTLKTGRVIVSGMGKSGHVGRKIAATFASMGTPSFFVHPSEAAHGDLGMITKKDMVFLISNSGESKEMFAVMDFCLKFKIPYVAITRADNSTLAKNANVKLTMPNIPECCPIGKAPTTSTTMTMALGDALCVVMAQRNGLSDDVYKHWHPGGKLGNSLAKVSEVFDKKHPVIVIKENAELKDLLKKLEKHNGDVKITVVCKNGYIKGHIHHHNILSALQNNEQENSVSKFMNEACSVDMKSGILDAIEELNKFKSDFAYVLKNNKPVGVITLKDLMNMKK